MKLINKLRSSMAFNIIGSIVLLLAVFSFVVSLQGYLSFTDSFKKEYSVSTYHIADTAATLINGDHIDNYLAGEMQEEYLQTKSFLEAYCDRIHVSLLYVVKVNTKDYATFKSVFNCVNNFVGNTDYTPWELGYERPATNEEYIRKYKELYEQTVTYETVYRTKPSDSKNPHITTLVPVKDSWNNTVAILCVQRPARELIDARRPYLVNVAFTAVILAAIASVLVGIFMHNNFMWPIRKMSDEAVRFAKENTKGEPLGEISKISAISDLAVSIDTMENDMTTYIENLTAATAEQERFRTELTLAGIIQENSIPNTFPAYPDRKDFDIYGYMTPAREVGGDFYNFFLIDDDHLAMVIGDVSGKGIPASLFMMATNIMISGNVKSGNSPAQVLTYVNNNLCEHNSADMFVTLWIGILEMSTGKLAASNGGHEYPVIRRNGIFELFRDKHGFICGGMPGLEYTDYEIQLKPGDMIFVYTDGVPEATNKDNRLFGNDRMLEALNQDTSVNPEAVIRNIITAVGEFVGEAEQFDDLTMLCVEYKGKDGK